MSLTTWLFPKRRVESVFREIVAGLRDGSVVLEEPDIRKVLRKLRFHELQDGTGNYMVTGFLSNGECRALWKFIWKFIDGEG